MIINKYNLPNSIVKAVENIDNSYDLVPDSKTISVTTLIDSPYIAYLRRKHKDDIEIDVVDRLAAMRGTIIHGVLENVNLPNTVTELRVNHNIDYNGEIYTISGKGDLYDVDTNVLQDYKVLKGNSWQYFRKLGYKPEWENQLNVLKYLYNAKGLKVDKLQIVAIFIELTNFEMLQHDMPDKPVMVIDIPVWDISQANEYIMERIRLHTAENIPVCNEIERQVKPPKWALKKNGNKKATKVYDSKRDADNAKIKSGKEYYVEYRQGESARCGYCDVKKFCQLWK